MLIHTGVQYNHRRVYRLIGRDLYSAATNKPLDEQFYTLESAEVIAPDQAERRWRVIMQGGEVCLKAEE